MTKKIKSFIIDRMKKPEHILAIRLSAMGDVAMAVPVIKTVLHQNPTVKITVISKGFTKPMWNNIDRLQFIEVDLKKNHKGILGIYKLYKELKKLQFDAVADLHNVLRSKILRNFFKATIPVQYINKGRKEKKALCTTNLNKKIFKPLKTTPERYADVLRALGLQVDLDHIQLKQPEAYPANAVTLLTPTINSKFVGIAPFAAHDGKKYPLDLMTVVIEQLAKQYPVLLFGGGSSEIHILKKINQEIPNTFLIAGNFNFQEELAIISNLSLMISMDSANGHLAAMYSIPTITLWGTTHPYAGFAPINQIQNCLIADRNQYPLLPTSVYGNKMIPGYENVFRTISPESIVTKAFALL